MMPNKRGLVKWKWKTGPVGMSKGAGDKKIQRLFWDRDLAFGWNKFVKQKFER